VVGSKTIPDSTMTKKFNRLVFPSSEREMRNVIPAWYENESVIAGGSPKRRVKFVPSQRKRFASPWISSMT
jgi:hypothetical protein